MRLWPYQMIDVLPRKHLVSQWRECLAISGVLASKGVVNHSTVNRLNEYDIEHFVFYTELIRKEFYNRGYRIGQNTIEKLNNDINFENILPSLSIKEILENKNYTQYEINGNILFKNFHNDRYIKQCLYMFQEKYDTNYLTEEEWSKLANKFKNYIEY